ncbi:glycosyltransferase family 2 protein [Reticulibacter mediterranei]|nr:glycosyltransferase family 2 protein [Reticulibacter mediterranei]
MLDVTVIIPAYNEAGSIADTIKSLQEQTYAPKEIVVVDDSSMDTTGDVARSYNVKVLRPPKNTGSKAGAQNFALAYCSTTYTMAIDADTCLALDSIENLFSAFSDSQVAAACGFVVPRYKKTLWERARYIEYLIAFTFYKPIQDYFTKPLISSGCFSMYNTHILKEMGGWSVRTLAEDMDLTWSLYEKGYRVRFISSAVCYPIDPHNYTFMSKQLKRWSHGFVQNLKLHWKNILQISFLNFIIAVATWDAIIASLVFLFVLPLLSLILHNVYLLLGYIVDAPVIFVPVVYAGILRKELKHALLSFPTYFLLRIFSAFFILEAFWTEIVMRETLNVYEKGH